MKFFQKSTGCDRMVSLLNDYSEGELSPSQLREVELHLASCAPCRQELRVVDGVFRLVRQMDRVAPPRDLWPSVRQAISQAPAEPWPVAAPKRMTPLPGAPLGRRWLAPVAAIGAAAAVGLGLFWPRSSSPPSFVLPLPTASSQQIQTTSYFTQAEQAAMFEPFADRASLGTIVEVSDRTPVVRSSNGFSGQATIDDAMAHGTMEGMGQ